MRVRKGVTKGLDSACGHPELAKNTLGGRNIRRPHIQFFAGLWRPFETKIFLTNPLR